MKGKTKIKGVRIHAKPGRPRRKLHWTQTPEGKAHFARRSAERIKTTVRQANQETALVPQVVTAAPTRPNLKDLIDRVDQARESLVRAGQELEAALVDQLDLNTFRPRGEE